MSMDRIEPNRTDGVPWCNSTCPSFDGKRCEKLGFAPATICEPAVREMVSALQQTRTDFAAINEQYHPKGHAWAEWTTVANTDRWIQKILGVRS